MFNPDRDWAWQSPGKPDRKSHHIQPAFASRTQAVFFLFVVALALGLPYIIDQFDLVSREDSYDLVPAQHGGFSLAKREIFEIPDDIDLLFVGSSVLFSGIDTPQVQKELSVTLGREARVRTFGHYFNSFDITYMQVKDLLEQKRVRMLALSVPRMKYTEGPSPLAHWFVRYGESSEVMASLPARDHAALYAGSVLRSPRDLLSCLRRERVTPSKWADNLGADIAKLGMGRSPRDFVRFEPKSPTLTAASMIYSPDKQERFEFIEDPIPPYQFQYFRSLVELARDYNVPVMIINVPQKTEVKSTRVIERMNWSRTFSTEIPLIGVQPAVLFSGLSEKEIDALFFDEAHFNANGNKFFTQTVLPAIVTVYKEHAKAN